MIQKSALVTSDEKPLIAIIIPCYNEENHISSLLHFFKGQEYPVNKMEIFVVDGNSTDGSKKIIREFEQLNPELNIRLLDNPDKTVPYALNTGLRHSIGNPVVRMDVHTRYASDYIVKVVETFNRTGADIAGGPMRAEGITNFQKAVAYCTSTKFGVGDSRFHDEKAEGFVDSVYLGAWKREIFSEVGLFDIQLKRNQDDEFHYRARSMGKKIYLNPEIKSWYYPRDNLRSLFKQYFQYGFFKPLVLKKVSSEIKPRHIIPSLFLLYILTLPVTYHFTGMYSFMPLLIYLCTDFLYSFFNKNNWSVKFFSLLVYPLLHSSYGSGFIAGLVKLILGEKSK